MHNHRQENQTADLSDEALADLLTEPPDDGRHRAAIAEFRLRDHRALLAQSEAAERTATATISYTRYTLGVLIAAVLAVVASWLALFWR